MASKKAPSTKDYKLRYGMMVTGLDKPSGEKVSYEVSSLLMANGDDKIQAATFLKSLNVATPLVGKFGKGDKEGDRVYAFSITPSQLKKLCDNVLTTVKLIDEVSLKQISGNTTTKKGGKGTPRSKYNFDALKKAPSKKAPVTPQTVASE